MKQQKYNGGGLDYFREYCDNATIHGLKYIGEKDRPVMEKIWWTVLLIVCIFVCCDLTQKTYERWTQQPIIVGFKQKPVPVWSIPFPAVTICPQTKSRQTICDYTALFNDWSNNKEISEEGERNLTMLSYLCLQDGPLTNFFPRNFTTDILDFFDEIAPKLSDMKAECSWRNNFSIPCNELFTPVFTIEGICYTFNSLDHKDLYRDDVVPYKNYGVNNQAIRGWDTENGYTDHTLGINTYPYRDLYLSRKSVECSGLTIDLGIQEDDMDYLCTGADQGFKVFLHYPAEVLRQGQQFFFAPLKQVSEIIILPEMMVTSDELKTYAPDVRQCYYPHEKPLRYFKTYTKRNCEMECLSNLTYYAFRCATFYMPRMKYRRICDANMAKWIDILKDANVAMKEAFNFNFNFVHMAELIDKDYKKEIRSYIKARNILIQEEMWQHEYNFTEILYIMNGTTNVPPTGIPIDMDDYSEYHSLVNAPEEVFLGLQCDCRPSCTSLKYNAKKTLKDFNWQQHKMVTQKNVTNYEGMQFARIIVIYADNKILTSERKELFGFLSFVGNCGGLLGIFTGFSFLSGFEILYYLTIRLWYNIKNATTNGTKKGTMK